MKKTCLITGVAGFIGHHLANLLLKKGYKVIGVDNLSTGKEEMIPRKVDFYQNDIKDKLFGAYQQGKSLLLCDQPVDEIYHLAAQARIQRSWDNPEKTYQDNVEGTRNILELAKKWEVKKVLVTSSNSVYGEYGLYEDIIPMNEDMVTKPISPYAFHKAIDEKLAEMYSVCWNIDIVVARPFNVYGPDQPIDSEYSCVFPTFQAQKRAGKPLTIYGDGTQSRDFTHVDDVVMGMHKIMNSDKWEGFEIVNLCTGKRTDLLELANMFNHAYALVENPRNQEMIWTQGSNEKLKELTNFIPKKNLKKYVRRYAK